MVPGFGGFRGFRFHVVPVPCGSGSVGSIGSGSIGPGSQRLPVAFRNRAVTQRKTATASGALQDIS